VVHYSSANAAMTWFTYTYDANWNRSTGFEMGGNFSTYTYDAENRLMRRAKFDSGEYRDLRL